MLTPLSLIGIPNPWDGKPFAREIKRGLNTRNRVEARKRRDVFLGDLRKLQLDLRSGGDRWSIEAALEWREMYQEASPEERDGYNHVLNDRIDDARERNVPSHRVKRFLKIKAGEGFPLSKALPIYLEERKPNNSRGYKPLAKTTVLNVKSAIKHLQSFIGSGDDDGGFCLEEVTHKKAVEFKSEYLPLVPSGRGTGTMSAATNEKNITLLRSLWAWAIERNLTAPKYTNPWEFTRSTPRVRTKQKREEYSVEEVSKLFQATKRGTRQGDLLRLALATGCRADELAALPAEAVDKDGSGFRIGDGKTENARRYVPVTGAAQSLLLARLKAHGKSGRLFPDWPLRPELDKAYSVSQWFTRFRRDVLGADTDGRLSLHSTRHTWRTAARRARVTQADVDELGGWASKQGTSSVYDHGLLDDQLRNAQIQIWKHFDEAGYLEHF